MAHASTKGQRDFSSVRQLVATHYDLIARGGTVDRARSMLSEAGLLPQTEAARTLTLRPSASGGRRPALTVPVWAWATFLAFVIAMLALDVFVLHRRAHEVSLREAGIWSAVWIVLGLGFGGLVWAWAGGATAQAYLAGYLIEKSLSVDNIFLFAAIFSAFAIPARYQHRVLMFGIIGALVMRAAFIAAGISLLEAVHPVIYVFGAVLLVAAFNMLRGGTPCRAGAVARAAAAAAVAAGHRRAARPAVPGARRRQGSSGAACWPPRCCSPWWSSRPPTSSSPSTRSRRSSR